MHQPSYAFQVGIGWDFEALQPVYYCALLQQGLSRQERWERTIFRVERDARFEAQEVASVVYSQVTVRREGKGRTVYQYDWPITHGTLSRSEWAPSKSKVARQALTGRTYDDFGPLATFHAYPHGPLPRPDHQQGLLRTVNVFDQAGNIEEATTYDYQYLQTDPIQALRIGQLPVLASNGSADINEKMFVYRIYTLQTGNVPLIQRTITKNYHATDQHQWQVTTQEYTYPASTDPYPTYPVHQYSTDSKGTKRGSKYTYPFHYSTPSGSGAQDNATQGILKLKEKHILSVPLEVTHTYQRAGGSEQVLGGSLQQYTYISSQNIVKHDKTYVLRVGSPVSNFQASSISGDGSYSLSMDPRYELLSQVTHRDQWGNATTYEGLSKVAATTLTAMSGALPKATFSRANYTQVAYENFEDRDAENSGGFIHSSNYSGGRINGQGLGLSSDAGDRLTKQLSKGGADTFIVSMWVNASSAGTLTLTCTADVHSVQDTLNFSNTDTEWDYYEATLDLTSLGNDFTVALTTDAFGGLFVPYTNTSLNLTDLALGAYRSGGAPIKLNGGSGNFQDQLSKGLYLADLPTEPLKDVSSAFNQSNRELLENAVSRRNKAHTNGTRKAVEKGLSTGKVVRVAGGVMIIVGVATDFTYGVNYLMEGETGKANGSFAMARLGAVTPFYRTSWYCFYGIMLMDEQSDYTHPTIYHQMDNTTYVVPSKIILDE